MANLQHDEQDLGFNPEKTRDELTKWLFANCANVATQLPGEGTDQPDSENERQAALWNRAEAAAMVHGALHGVPSKIQEDDGELRDAERCVESPCKASGASFGLLELCLDWRDRRRAAFSMGIDALAVHLTALDVGVPLALEESSSTLLAHLDRIREVHLSHAAAREAAGDHEGARELRQASENGDRFVSGWRATLELGKDLAVGYRELTALAVLLRQSHGVIGTAHRTLPSERGPGRPKSSLLTAVLQSLKDGGFTYAQMRQLVVGMAGTAASPNPAAVKDQIRTRLRQANRRSVRPFRE